MSLEARERNPDQGGLRAKGVVESLPINKDVVLRGGSGRGMPEMNAFTFETAEEVFSNGVVIGITFAGHTLTNAMGLQTVTIGPGSILNALVTVEDQAHRGLAAAVGHVQSRRRQLRINPL